MPALKQAQRRPIPSRTSRWAVATAPRLQRAGVGPNQISILGLVFAAMAAACLLQSGRTEGGVRSVLLLLAAGFMPLRLLCNMLDGMLAVEGGLQSRTGMLYNELPDRLSDLLILTAAGYAVPGIPWAPALGWLAATTALLTAYVRSLGVAAGAKEHFEGVMAKPRRMHVLIAACVLSSIPALGVGRNGTLIVVALLIISLGDVVTIAQRLRLIVGDLSGP